MVCLNERERLTTRERRYDEIDRALALLEKKKPIKEGLRKLSYSPKTGQGV